LDAENKKLQNELNALGSSHGLSSPHSTPVSPTVDGIAVPSEVWPASSNANVAVTRSVDSSEVVQLPAIRSEERHHSPRSSSEVPLVSIVYSLVASMSVSSYQKTQSQRDKNSPTAYPSLLVPPSRDESDRAIEAYFDHWHLTFPLLCKPLCLRTVEKIYSEPEYYTENPFEAFCFDMVLAMGSVNFNRPDWSTNSPERHYLRAISRLDKVLSLKDLPPLQAIIFLCQYSIFCSLQDTSANMWHLVGIAVRLCMEMGLHRRSCQEEYVARGLQAGRISLALEARKRTFWCLYNLDRYANIK
jgi:hypothetical protein